MRTRFTFIDGEGRASSSSPELLTEMADRWITAFRSAGLVRGDRIVLSGQPTALTAAVTLAALRTDLALVMAHPAELRDGVLATSARIAIALPPASRSPRGSPPRRVCRPPPASRPDRSPPQPPTWRSS
jgi:acyl-CoA synthetase (AMP-forming)/AMP-acid ligase II